MFASIERIKIDVNLLMNFIGKVAEAVDSLTFFFNTMKANSKTFFIVFCIALAREIYSNNFKSMFTPFLMYNSIYYNIRLFFDGPCLSWATDVFVQINAEITTKPMSACMFRTNFFITSKLNSY